MSITIEQAKNLKPGQTVYHVTNKNADGSAQRWKVNGEPKTWKRSPDRVEVPVKHGMYTYGKITEKDLHLVNI